ncbi:MAG: Omp28 family outer membrane lipoprotein [Muribaculaceae bacterium]|nr:Omp28 family outer membrane lipoprotein [Muribaculaceae bacterium]
MKKFLLLIATFPFLIACDNIDEKDRYIQVENRPLERKVLLEEFTGQNCVNCPDAHAVIEKLEEQFGENLVVVSIHAGSFGISSEMGGLMQEEGNIYADHWRINAYPCGVIDRNSGVLNFDQWSTVIRKDGLYPANMEMDLNAELSEDGTKINITTDLVSDGAVKGALQLWVVENGIEGYQRDGDIRRYDYIHNNVFRACVNGEWGEEIDMVNGDTEHFYNSIEVVSGQEEEINDWNVNNLYIVGFVYNDSGVVVVNKCKIE